MKKSPVFFLSSFIFGSVIHGAPFLEADFEGSDLNILVIGSTHSFSEGSLSGTREASVLEEQAFDPTVIASHLENIIDQDTAIAGPVNVVFEDIFKTKQLTVRYSSTQTYDFTSHCYSLAQHFMWTDGRTARLANLRGEGAVQWDYIILCGDPYIKANFPGMYAEGVRMIQEEVAKSANPAQVVLLAQWPENSSTFTADDFNEVVHRVGDSADLSVVSAGKVWDSYGAQDINSAHPTPKGAYLAAASIYSKLYNRSASTSAYDFAPDGDAIADHAFAELQSLESVPQYSGDYAVPNAFLGKSVTKRTVSYNETGTSTEDGIARALHRLDDVLGITFTTSRGAYSRWDFNYGRGNDWWEDHKDYEVNPGKFDRSYGFPMHHYTRTNAAITMPYGIDKHYWHASWGGLVYEDGTDLGIAYNMVRPFTRETGLPEGHDVRAIPIRLMWLKMREIWPSFGPLGDNIHMNAHLDDATASFMYTLLSGRCPVVEEPATPGSSEWLQWLGHKIGYETAWQMWHLTTRAPGFRVLPSAAAATTLTPGGGETMTVRFANPPQADVTVNVTIAPSTGAIVSPKTLVFTPANYDTPQEVSVTGLPGASSSETFEVVYSTTSDDAIYDDLSDAWAYSVNRSSSTGALHQVDLGTQQVTLNQYNTVDLNLGVAGATSSNASFAGRFHGSITWGGPQDIQYTPTGNYLGTDQIVYAVTIGGTQSIGTIDLTIQQPAGQVNVVATDALAFEEGPVQGSYTISRLGDTSAALSVFFTLEGTATPGDDYSLSHTSPVTIPAGQDSITVILTPVDDDIFGERYETAVLRILEDAAYPIGINPATVTIVDNDNQAPTADAGSDQSAELDPPTILPGLYYGTVPSFDNVTTPNPKTQILVDPSVETENSIAGNTTEIYTGSIFDADGQISFTEHIDDAARIWIDGVPVLADTAWSTRTSTANLNLTPGWHDIEIRISNGSGGSGPVGGEIGIGYDPNGGTAWQTLTDPGDASFLRVSQASAVDVSLSGAVSDPEDDPLTTTWSVESGPAAVAFADASALATTATFTKMGVYVLRLTVDDGFATSSDLVTITLTQRDYVPPKFTVVASGSNVDGTIDAIAGGKTISIDAGAMANLLVVGTSTEFGSGTGITATYDGNPMTLASGNGAQSNLFYLDLSGTGYAGGAADLVFSWDYTLGGDLAVGWVSLEAGLDAGETIELHSTAFADSTTGSVDLVTTVGDTFNFVNFNGNKGIAGSVPQAPLITIYSNGSFGSNGGAAGYETHVAAGSHAYSWNHDQLRRIDAAAFAIVTGGGNTYSDWISGYGLVGLDGFSEDHDGDGLANGLENYFGTHPGEFSAGVRWQSVDTGNRTFSFSHPMSDNPASDLSAAYRWSKDLTDFHYSGDIDTDGTTVHLAPGTPTGGILHVTGTISGTPTDRIFIDIEVTQTVD